MSNLVLTVIRIRQRTLSRLFVHLRDGLMPPAKMRFPPETIGWLVGSHIYHTSTAVILNIKLALHQFLGYAAVPKRVVEISQATKPK